MDRINEEDFMRELCMLTGKVNKDKNYLYYLLVKDGSYFNKEKPVSGIFESENKVEDFASWFDRIEV